MASTHYSGMVPAMANGAVVLGADLFFMLLVTDAYTVDAEDHANRDDVSGELVGSGYDSGGQQTEVTVEAVTGGARITFGQVEWNPVSGSPAGAVIYKRRGGEASADELVAYLDFGGAVPLAGDSLVVAAVSFTLTVS